MPTVTRVMIIDDHPLLREALKGRIQQVSPNAEFAYIGASVAEALAVHESDPVDCTILDLDLGDGQSPVVNTSELVSAGCRVLIVSALADAATVRGALRAGALGFVSKQTDIQDFETPSVPLSERERTAIVLYAWGLKLDAVARRMNVKPAAAQEYVRRVREKYSRAGAPVATKTDLYRRARDEGLVR